MRNSRSRSALLAGLFLALSFVSRAESGRDPRSGLYVIWYPQDQKELYLGNPLVKGGQVVVQWGDVEPGPGTYDFSDIDARFADFETRGQSATLQINGNHKPAWLFDQVPVYPGALSEQVNDKRGTLAYWHPVHREAYLGLIRALAGHIAQQPWRGRILGVRLNFNALGTEHYAVPPEAQDPKAWTFPEGVDRQSLVPWTRAVGEEYRDAVVHTYLDSFKGVAYVFVRNNVDDAMIAPYRADIDAGRIGWFHTSSEAEPRSNGTQRQYRRFYDDCRSGKTVGYAEPWASAWGDHGGKRDDRWCSPEQWNYWRLLLDLNCGVSFIAPYSSDFRVAIDGHYGNKVPPEVQKDPARGATMQAEFAAAYAFAAKYAGWHADPGHAPGAWIAFRENDTVLAENGMSAKQRQLDFFNTDYTFLMSRLPGDNSRGQGVITVGPDTQRYGAWARILPAGDSIRLAADPAFTASLGKSGADIAVTFLDDAAGTFHVGAHEVTTGNTGVWRTEIWHVTPEGILGSSDGGQIAITAGASPLTLHMLEIRRPD